MPESVEDQLFLAPCSREYKDETFEHFQRTILDGIDIRRYDSIKDVDLPQTVSIWGVLSGNQGSWRRMSRGDVVLFYTKRGVYTHAARVYHTEKNEALSEEIWNTYDGHRLVQDLDEPWPYLIFLYDVQRVDIPVAELHPVIGWKSDYPQGFTRVGDDGQQRIRDRYGSVPAFLRRYTQNAPDTRNDGSAVSEVKDELYSATRNPPVLTEELDYTNDKRQIRSAAFHEVIREIYDDSCAVCGAHRESPAGDPEVEAAHIYPRSELGSDDIRNGLALCKLHHWAFDSGWLSLDNDHCIVTDGADRPGSEEFSRLDGRPIRLPADEQYAPHPRFMEAHRALYGFD